MTLKGTVLLFDPLASPSVCVAMSVMDECYTLHNIHGHFSYKLRNFLANPKNGEIREGPRVSTWGIYVEWRRDKGRGKTREEPITGKYVTVVWQPLRCCSLLPVAANPRARTPRRGGAKVHFRPLLLLQEVKLLY